MILFLLQRGGAANIGSPGIKATHRTDDEIIPEAAIRASMDTDTHVGRGGEGNIAHPDGGEPNTTMHQGLADKLKYKLFGKKLAGKEHKPEAKPEGETVTEE
jgi:hypothetical protein